MSTGSVRSQGAGGGGSSAIVRGNFSDRKPGVVVAAGGGGAGGLLDDTRHAGAGGDAGRKGNDGWPWGPFSACENNGGAAGGKPEHDGLSGDNTGNTGGGGAGEGGVGKGTWNNCGSGGGGGASRGSIIGIDDRAGRNAGLVVLEWQNPEVSVSVLATPNPVKPHGAVQLRAEIHRLADDAPAPGHVEFVYGHEKIRVPVANGIAVAKIPDIGPGPRQLEYAARYDPDETPGYAPSYGRGLINITN